MSIGTNTKEIFIKTDDEWYNTFEGNKVKVVLNLNRSHFGEIYHQIIVWGNDDFAIHKIFWGEEKAVMVEALYNKLTNQEVINKEQLFQLDFEVF